MTKEEVFNLIRQRLSFGDELQQQLRHVDKDKFMKEHRRFEMSGFETQTGWCTVFNNDILNKFADLGIYNYTSSLDFSEFSLLESSFLSVCVCVFLADAVLFPHPTVPIDTAAHKMAITIFLFILYPLYL